MTLKNLGKTILQFNAPLPVQIGVSAVVMAALIALVYCFNIPNPNMILIAGLVMCSATFGFGGGIVAAIIMFFYTLIFFSTGHNMVDFTPQNTQKVIVSLIGILVDMLFVCFLKHSEVKAFQNVAELTEQLRVENEQLQEISLFDPLTGIKNRLALRKDYDSYNGHDVTVMMMDIDNFKRINDVCGHAEGDRALKGCAARLSAVFGRDYTYRYGGDEFLVIFPDESEACFRAKLDTFSDGLPTIEMDGTRATLGFSFGYVHETLTSPERLRELFIIADERMYAMKQSHHFGEGE